MVLVIILTYCKMAIHIDKHAKQEYQLQTGCPMCELERKAIEYE